MKVTCQIEKPEYAGAITKLQAAIKYGEEDLPGAKSLVDQSPSEDPDTEINLGCLLYKVLFLTFFACYCESLVDLRHAFVGTKLILCPKHQQQEVTDVTLQSMSNSRKRFCITHV